MDARRAVLADLLSLPSGGRGVAPLGASTPASSPSSPSSSSSSRPPLATAVDSAAPRSPGPAYGFGASPDRNGEQRQEGRGGRMEDGAHEDEGRGKTTGTWLPDDDDGGGVECVMGFAISCEAELEELSATLGSLYSHASSPSSSSSTPPSLASLGELMGTRADRSVVVAGAALSTPASSWPNTEGATPTWVEWDDEVGGEATQAAQTSLASLYLDTSWLLLHESAADDSGVGGMSYARAEGEEEQALKSSPEEVQLEGRGGGGCEAEPTTRASDASTSAARGVDDHGGAREATPSSSHEQTAAAHGDAETEASTGARAHDAGGRTTRADRSSPWGDRPCRGRIAGQESGGNRRPRIVVRSIQRVGQPRWPPPCVALPPLPTTSPVRRTPLARVDANVARASVGPRQTWDEAAAATPATAPGKHRRRLVETVAEDLAERGRPRDDGSRRRSARSRSVAPGGSLPSDASSFWPRGHCPGRRESQCILPDRPASRSVRDDVAAPCRGAPSLEPSSGPRPTLVPAASPLKRQVTEEHDEGEEESHLPATPTKRRCARGAAPLSSPPLRNRRRNGGTTDVPLPTSPMPRRPQEAWPASPRKRPWKASEDEDDGVEAMPISELTTEPKCVPMRVETEDRPSRSAQSPPPPPPPTSLAPARLRLGLSRPPTSRSPLRSSTPSSCRDEARASRLERLGRRHAPARTTPPPPPPPRSPGDGVEARLRREESRLLRNRARLGALSKLEGKARAHPARLALGTTEKVDVSERARQDAASPPRPTPQTPRKPCLLLAAAPVAMAPGETRAHHVGHASIDTTPATFGAPCVRITASSPPSRAAQLAEGKEPTSPSSTSVRVGESASTTCDVTDAAIHLATADGAAATVAPPSTPQARHHGQQPRHVASLLLDPSPFRLRLRHDDALACVRRGLDELSLCSEARAAAVAAPSAARPGEQSPERRLGTTSRDRVGGRHAPRASTTPSEPQRRRPTDAAPYRSGGQPRATPATPSERPSHRLHRRSPALLLLPPVVRGLGQGFDLASELRHVARSRFVDQPSPRACAVDTTATATANRHTNKDAIDDGYDVGRTRVAAAASSSP